jgi:hypothetical protein
MEAIIFIGIQATGKSTFFQQRFFVTHVRINLDMLKTRNRERILLVACLEDKQPFVIDNTNLTREARPVKSARQKPLGSGSLGITSILPCKPRLNATDSAAENRPASRS